MFHCDSEHADSSIRSKQLHRVATLVVDTSHKLQLRFYWKLEIKSVLCEFTLCL